MLHAGKVRLGRVGEQTGAGVLFLEERGPERGLVHAHVASHQGHIGHGGPLLPGVLADALHRVVVVPEQQVLAARRKRIGLPQQLQRMRGIGREDDLVLVRGGAEELEDGGPGPLVEICHGLRRGVDGVRVAKDVAAEQLMVSAELGASVEARPRVVEVDVFASVEGRVVPLPQTVDEASVLVFGIGLSEGPFGLFLGELPSRLLPPRRMAVCGVPVGHSTHAGTHLSREPGGREERNTHQTTHNDRGWFQGFSGCFLSWLAVCTRVTTRVKDLTQELQDKGVISN
ncbi:hypothetical protein VTO42DRAFT_1815 [Malbranchea cinnamomea]